ncbi:SGNH/GDSL hydrolase family protein [Noviherbaspirillum saxi]|uniref:SGNH/GDSL hydrolase family protein n=1 Tax=Noviherbaspirillum saxi TaxID=2320863 RepID=UPI001F2E74C6|nr:SGNH/GDSL hydrolase family protein [Noviherbaspirillum saxi]
MKRLFIALFSCAAALTAAASHSQPVTPDSGLSTTVAAIDPKWASSFAAFEQADKEKAPPPGGVLFVGSSSIRLWDGLETQFEAMPVVVKRGFGGSRMEDCKNYLGRLVVPYKPRLVIVYAGDNDLAEGRTPEQVMQSFSEFVKGVHTALPDTKIAYMSIKPSPARRGLLDKVRATNTLIENYIASSSNIRYIDIFTPMLDANGNPRTELFREDALHLNTTGYALWKSVISAQMTK